MSPSTEQRATGTLEEIGRRDHEVTSEYRIFGPPGTGKTTNLTRQIQRAVERYGPESILVTSFSRAAAAELAGRDLPIASDRVGTLHSHCWHALGGPEVAEANVEEWNKDNPHLAITPQRKQGRLDGEEAVDEDAESERSGDQELQRLSRFRGLMLSRDLWPPLLVQFDKKWTEYKRENGLLDFTDLIEKCLREVALAPNNPAVIFGDEAQDLNRMQLSLIRKWGDRASYFIVAELCKQGTPIGKREAESARDSFFAEREAKTAAREKEAAEASERAAKPFDPDDVIIGNLADLWRKDYVENPKVKLAKPTRDKYKDRLENHILPRWKGARLKDLNDSKAVLDWLHHECSSWHMMIDLRNIMSGMITRAQEWNVIPRSFANPMQWVKIGKKWTVRPDRIYTPEETAWVFSHLPDPHLLICETCLYTGTRISEAVGLQLKHFDPETGTIRIAQRHCRGDVDEPKTKNSKRVLALGALTARYKEWIAKRDIKLPNAWIFAQDDKHGGRHNGDPNRPMWDSGVRGTLKAAARACKTTQDKNDPGLDFPGMGLHSFRRANITWRQGVGKASAIEASKIAGHATVSMTGDYTFVPVERQEETTRPIQERMERAKANVVEIRKKEAAA